MQFWLLSYSWPWSSRSIDPQNKGVLTKVFCILGPNLVILAWMGEKFSTYKLGADTQDRHTDTGNNNTQRPNHRSSGEWIDRWHQKGPSLAIYDIPPKFIFNSNFTKTCFSIIYFQIIISFWNCAQSITLSLLCCLKNFKITWQLKWILWVNKYFHNKGPFC